MDRPTLEDILYRVIRQAKREATSEEVAQWASEISSLLLQRDDDLIRIAYACDEISIILAHLGKAIRKEVDDELETRDCRNPKDISYQGKYPL